MANVQDTRNMALFCDFENVALGVREAKYAQFDISRVLERLLLSQILTLYITPVIYLYFERLQERLKRGKQPEVTPGAIEQQPRSA